MPSELVAQPRPGGIDVSYWLWLTACLAGMITAAVTLRYFGELQAAVLSTVERQFPEETPAMRDEVAAATLVTLISAGVVLILTQMALAITMRSGRGWARFTLVGFTLLSALYSLAVFGAVPMTTRAGLLATIALMLVATIPMFRSNARAWFDNQHLRRS